MEWQCLYFYYTDLQHNNIIYEKKKIIKQVQQL